MWIVRSVSVVVVVALACGCDSEKKSTTSGIAAIASGSLAVKQRPSAAVPAPSAGPPKKVVRHVGESEALTVTDAIRAKLENRHPEAAGFLTVDAIEEKLFALELKRGKDDEALKHLDRIAKGKWILMTGPITGATPEGFDLPIRYTPRDPADPMGLTSQWLNIALTGLEGYDQKEYQSGERTAVLVRYDGDKAASPGFDLILTGEWYE